MGARDKERIFQLRFLPNRDDIFIEAIIAPVRALPSPLKLLKESVYRINSTLFIRIHRYFTTNPSHCEDSYRIRLILRKRTTFVNIFFTVLLNEEAVGLCREGCLFLHLGAM